MKEISREKIETFCIEFYIKYIMGYDVFFIVACRNQTGEYNNVFDGSFFPFHCSNLKTGANSQRD
jgi:hypothetical protein